MSTRLVGNLGHQSLLIFDSALARSIENSPTMILDCTYEVEPRIEILVPILDRTRQLMLVSVVKNDCVSTKFVNVGNYLFKHVNTNN